MAIYLFMLVHLCINGNRQFDFVNVLVNGD